MTQVELLGRMIDWFSHQDTMVKLLVAGQLKEDEHAHVLDYLFWQRHGFQLPDPDRLRDVAAQVAADAETQRRIGQRRKGA